MTAVERVRSSVRRSLPHLVRVGVFLVIGPVVGGLVLLAIFAVKGRPDSLGVLLYFPVFATGCYMMGWKAALLAGAVFSLIAPRLETRRMVVATGATIGAVATLFVGPSEALAGRHAELLLGLIGAVAATSCAWLLDSLDLARTSESSTA